MMQTRTMRVNKQQLNKQGIYTPVTQRWNNYTVQKHQQKHHNT